MTAAMVGGTAYVAGKDGAKSGAEQAQQQQQQQQAPPPQEYAAPPAAAPQAGGAMSQESMDQLQKLAQLHEQGILTDAEFEVQKQKILQGM
ncbi:MAG TPA: SHOCT domain-containing protein [Gaiellaceae bacterium]|nr:SHOCT domain-containing protein [Gaiellaceae bacterium]